MNASSRLWGDPVGVTAAIPARDPVVRRAGSHWVPCACLRLKPFNDDAFHFYEPLRRVRDHVESHGPDSLSLDGAAKIACLERSYFSTFFRRKAGITFSDWVGLLRVQKAAWLLVERDRCVDEVAQQVGWSRRTFERVFKRHTGQTPRQFRDGHRPGAPRCVGKLPSGCSIPTT